MTTWDDLDGELDVWQRIGRTISLWWRDDDAVEPTPALDRLLALAGNYHIPVGLAVIPARAKKSLPGYLEDHPYCSVLQHGYDHANHAPEGEKKAEYGTHRDRKKMLAELRKGRDRMKDFPRSLPVLVPPWNRIDGDLLANLGEAGFGAVSTFGPRAAARPAPNLRQVNTHCDPVAWHTDRKFMGESAALDQIIAHLSARRLGRADPFEPTGILTHHLAMDEAGWTFLETLFERSLANKAVKWLIIEEAFRG